MDTQYIKNLLKSIGFVPKEGSSGIWIKEYLSFKNYAISVSLIGKSFSDYLIDYGDKIKCQRSTTSNLSQSENLVVLECVNRLLDKGYGPENLILEKDWPLGHRGKGYLDIWVKMTDGKSFLMIECKTWGKEYNNEKSKTLEYGGQLFSYLAQERPTKFLCLYTSILENNELKFENDIIVINDQMRGADNQQEAFESWKPQIFETKGIFDNESAPYNLHFNGLLKKDLKPITAKDGGDIYNRFAEILRRNVVSDKTNAFNKIFNLFLCKIVDEFETNEDEATEFQWGENETNEDVMLRLNDLYKRGMDKYLNLKISAVTTDELNRQLENGITQDSKEAIKKLFIQQKLYTGNEFAFKEVFDKKTFEDNCIVVKEVVKLLERYRIKYSTKQQFLGDFFEKLLNTGIKQEAGQFFTPIPIARFIAKSIPIWETIELKNSNKNERFLPYCIDYASGSGHFLTELMAEIDKYVKNISDDWIHGGDRARNFFNSKKDSYIWAEEYIYGIEKDYRLAKTTKISTFLNGDGDANVICGDGLDSFSTSNDYKGKLKISNGGLDNEQFDILVANPPYSISGFKTTLKYGKKSFELFDNLTDHSSEIECLFVERAKQLIREGGFVGVILPISILSNSKIYLKTRELILKNFDIKGIVELGKNTFMATSTKTVILFLEKKDKDKWIGIRETIDSFFNNFKDMVCNSIENAFSEYISYVFKSISKEDYTSLFKGKPTKAILDHEIIQIYEDKFGSLKKRDAISAIIDIEKDKILNFILSYKKKVILVNSGADIEVEKRFLGYEFSSRRGYEGIKINSSTLLYDDNDLYTENKVNSYILKNFSNQPLPEPSGELAEHLKIAELHELIDFTGAIFEKRIDPSSIKKKVKFADNLTLTKLEELVKTMESGNRPRGGVKNIRTGIPSLGGEHVNLFGGISFSNIRYVPLDFYSKATQGKIKENDILICKDGAQTGKVGIVDNKFPFKEAMINEHLFLLRANEKIEQKYLYYFLLSDIGQILLKSSITGQAQGGLNRPNLLKVKIPVPAKSTRLKLISELDDLSEEENIAISKIDELEEDIRDKIKNADADTKVNLGKYISFEYGASLTAKDRVEGKFPVVGSNGIIGYHNSFLVDSPSIIIGRKGSVGKINLIDKPCYPIDTTFWVKMADSKFLFKYVYHLLKSLNLESLNNGIGPGGLNRNIAYSLKIPLPTLGEQERLIEIVEKTEKKISELQGKKELYAERKKLILNNALL